MASDINSVVLIGNLVRDVEVTYTAGGTAVAKMSIASNKSKKQQDGSWGTETSFFDITLFGKTAESLKQYLVKGKKIAVSGSLHQDRWKDKDGNNRSRVSVIADTLELLGGNDGQKGESQAEPNEAESMGFNEDVPF